MTERISDADKRPILSISQLKEMFEDGEISLIELKEEFERGQDFIETNMRKQNE